MIRFVPTSRAERLAGFALCALAIGAAASCRPGTPPGGAGPDAPELQGAVLVLLDTVRPDHLSGYGHDRPTSPALDALAEDGVVFEQVVSTAPWTLPSVVSILSGQQPGAVFRDNRLQTSIVETMRDAGIATAAFTEGGYVSRQFGLDRGFGEYVEEEGAVQLLDRGERPDAQAGGGIERTFRLAREWIEAHRDERFFVMIHTYEPHTPYRRPELTTGLEPGRVGETFGIERLGELKSGALQLDERELAYLAALYDGGILHSDRELRRLVGSLDSLGLRGRTLIAVTSDHGEELGEHYPRETADHGHSLLDDQVLVPLVINDPTLQPAISRVRAQVRTLDVVPTLAERLGVRTSGLAGASLTPLMLGTETAGRPAFGGSTKTGPRRFFLRHLGYKYIEVAARQPPRSASLTPTPPRVQLYDLQEDPGEQRNIAAERPDLVRTFARRLADLQSGTTLEEPVVPDDELLERLRSLGYAN